MCYNCYIRDSGTSLREWPIRPIHPSPVNSVNQDNSVNHFNSINHVNSVNYVNSVNHVNSVNSVKVLTVSTV